MSDLNSSVKNLENQLDCQEQYSHRNCILIYGITETQDKNTDDISLYTINGHLELELTEKELDQIHRIGNPKSGNKRPRPIIVKFACYNTRRKVFVNKEKVKKYWNFTYQKPDQTQNLGRRGVGGWNFLKIFGRFDGQICCYDEVVQKVKVHFD